MKIITHDMIDGLKLSPNVWYEWVETVLRHKAEYIMPAKITMHFCEGSYFNTMPGILPGINAMGVKVVNRYLGRTPSVESQMLLYEYTTGKLLSVMDSTYITTMRTGAVTAHAIDLLARSDFEEVGMMGLGNIGMAVLQVTLEHFKNKSFTLKLLRYKNHAEKTIERFNSYKNVTFKIVDSVEEVIRNSDVVISCITYTDKLLGKDEWFKEGCLVVPVHLRGFQNCDLFFDKIYGDDYGQVCGFQYFDRFRFFAESSQVLSGEKPGRENNEERIVSYNVGLALHDIYAAMQIYKKFENIPELKSIGPNERYWL